MMCCRSAGCAEQGRRSAAVCAAWGQICAAEPSLFCDGSSFVEPVLDELRHPCA